MLSVDEKSRIQALDHTPPLLPLRPEMPARPTHDSKRHGTTTLFSALSILDGKVISPCLPRHRSAEFIGFPRIMDRRPPSELDLHLIVDNDSTHKSPAVKRRLAKDKRFHLQFVPTKSSWLNMVERWFGLITQQQIRRGTFQSVPQLIEAINEYVENHNRDPIKFVWTKDADVILDKVDRCKAELGTGH